MSTGGAVHGGSYRYLPGGAGRGVARILHAAQGWIEARLDEERGRWFLWLPVLYGAGIALYLGARTEPSFPLCLALLMATAVLRHFLRLTALRLIFSTTLLMLALGLFAGKLRTLVVEAPVLTRNVGNAGLTGWIEGIEAHQKAFRLTLRIEAMEAEYRGEAPRRVRLRFHSKSLLPPVGSRVKLRASLRPPPEPVMPGGFDFARHSWFEGFGATGFAFGKVEQLDGEPPWDIRLAALVAGLRHGIAARIAAVLTGDTAALAQALIMGERGRLGEETRQALTDAGLAHVVSISGFHMALTAGSAFWLIRALLAAFPGLALAFPIKIWAAIGALFVASAYLVVSGGDVAAVRAYLMIAIMFGAMIVNRPAFSLRNLAISAFLILTVAPESLANPGFQMSFAATAALVAIYEDGLPQIGPPASWPGFVALPATLLIGAVITSLAAGLAVDPIGAYHFHRIPSYSVLGNLVAMPAVSVIVMPMALVTLLAIPFGLEAAPLMLMGWGIDAMIAIARFVAGLPGAVIAVPAFPLAALLAMVFGGLWLLLWRRRWRLWGLLPIALGLAAAPLGARPDIWIDREGKVIAARLKDGRLSGPKTRKGEFSLKAWLEADGDARTPKDAAKGQGFQCDEQSCLFLIAGRIVSHVLHPAALADDCRRASVLVTALAVPESCLGPDVIVDAQALWERGAHTIRIAPEGLVVRDVAVARGRRPWVVPRHRRELIKAAPDVPVATTVKPQRDQEALPDFEAVGAFSQ
jgi:competence protein ComEC